MNYKFFLLIFFLFSCTSNNTNKSIDTSNNVNKSIDTSNNVNKSIDTSNNINKSNDIIFNNSFSNFSNKGFALIYDDSLKKKKIISKRIEDRSLIIFQKNLTKGTTVKITNLINNKSLLAKVGPRSDYPSFYNSVIISLTTVTIDSSTSITVSEDVTNVELSAALITSPAGSISYNPYGSVSSTTVQAAIDELADDFYRGTETPGSGYEEGDLFYDTDDNLFRVYVLVSFDVAKASELLMREMEADQLFKIV